MRSRRWPVVAIGVCCLAGCISNVPDQPGTAFRALQGGFYVPDRKDAPPTAFGKQEGLVGPTDTGGIPAAGDQPGSGQLGPTRSPTVTMPTGPTTPTAVAPKPPKPPANINPTTEIPRGPASAKQPPLPRYKVPHHLRGPLMRYQNMLVAGKSREDAKAAFMQAAAKAGIPLNTKADFERLQKDLERLNPGLGDWEKVLGNTQQDTYLEAVDVDYLKTP